MNINITEKAQKELKKIMEENKENKKLLRIYIAGYGWGGPSFGLALDELKDRDKKVEVGGFTFLIEKDLADTFKGFTIDYSDNWLRRGFSIIPKKGGSHC